MTPLKISQISDYIQKLLKTDSLLQEITVEGEISQAKFSEAGHLYLTLKDESAQIAAVMFYSYAKHLDFTPEQGKHVEVQGSVDYYGKGGKLQFNITQMNLAGKGLLHQKFLEIKEKLEREGLFSVERKKPLPLYPNKIGVVASVQSAAISDFLKIARSRNPGVEILIAHSSVQGDLAPPQLITALRELDQRSDIDLIVITRGGGSIEDLWAFNDEELVRTIATCTHPVVSAVGHEDDYTLVDFVADIRASTPSNGAELVIDKRDDRIQRLGYLQIGLFQSLRTYLDRELRNLENQEKRVSRHMSPLILERERYKLTETLHSMEREMNRALSETRSALWKSKSAMEPKNILWQTEKNRIRLREQAGELEDLLTTFLDEMREKLTREEQALEEGAKSLHFHRVYQGERMILSAEQLSKEQPFLIEFYDGRVVAEVIEIQKEKK